MDLARTGQLPWLMLRPRSLDGDEIFQGDFDLLIDGSRFDDILRTVFLVCQQTGVSFVLRQVAPFKRQIELLDEQGRRVALELWAQAEFQTRSQSGHLSRTGVDYATCAGLDGSRRDALLAALFLLHLHHKGKNLQVPLTRERIDYFAARVVNEPGLAAALKGLQAGTLTLDDVHRMAWEFLREQKTPVIAPWRLALRRLGWHVRGALHWPSWRTTAVVGPDGSGKSALIDGIMNGPSGKSFRFQRFKRFFRRPLFYWFKHEPRNVRDEKLLWLVLPVAWTYFSVSRLFTGWRRPLILDRYFYDYFVRNVRVGSTEPFRRIAGYGLCTALVPRPRGLIVATCSVAVIHARKHEMDEAAIHAIYDMYRDQVVRGGLPMTLFCHTGISLEQSARHVLAFLGDPEFA